MKKTGKIRISYWTEGRHGMESVVSDYNFTWDTKYKDDVEALTEALDDLRSDVTDFIINPEENT